MEDERYSFLTSGVSGLKSLIIGGIDKGLAAFLQKEFQQVHLADWDRSRLDKAVKYFQIPEIKFTALDVGYPLVPRERFDYILALWVSNYLGEPQSWIEALVSKLEPRGKLVVIDDIDRPGALEQDIAKDIKKLRLAVDAADSSRLFPGCNQEQFLELFRSGALNRVRQLVYTAQDLLLGSEYWMEEAAILAQNLVQLDTSIDKKLLDDLRSRVSHLQDQLAENRPSTPPFVVHQGVKRSETYGYLKAKSDRGSINEPEQIVTSKNSIPTAPDPKDKLLTFGPDVLKNWELMAIALNANGCSDGSEKYDPTGLAKRIITEYGAKAVAEERNVGRLAELTRIPLDTACRIVALFTLGKRFYEEPFGRYPTIRSPEDAYIYLKDMGTLRKEHLRGLYLNVQSRLIHDEVLSIGTLSNSLVHPREVFSPALEYSANSIILAHNHPSGDLTPSDNDVTVTNQIAQAGRIMGIELVDHLIIGEGGFVSLRKKKII